jgi:hypothetical protein
VVVVLGASVVVVVAGSVVVVVASDEEPPDDAMEGVEVVDVEVEIEVEVEEVAVSEVLALLDPGCSPATTRPMRAVAPVADTTAARVSRRRRSWARSRVSAVWSPWAERGMTTSLSECPPSHHHDLDTLRTPAVDLL